MVWKTYGGSWRNWLVNSKSINYPYPTKLQSVKLKSIMKWSEEMNSIVFYKNRPKTC